jgi:regulator of protease activity HflC (stomatin/prohibitin superfamily)
MKKVFKVFIMVLALVALIVTTTGCYVNSGVSSNELGLQMGNGAKVDSVVGSGRYTNMGWFATIEKMDVSAKTAIWEDADLWTADKQPVNFKVSVTYARNRDAKSAQHMWEMYNSEARMDKALESLVLTRIPRVAKQVTTSMTLNEMIGISANNSTTGGREVLQQKLTELLTPELKEFDVTLLDIGVNDIGVDESYAQTSFICNIK